jgi:hypothetical protein
MRVGDEVQGQLSMRFEVLLPHLNERQQRLALACEARLLGHGGVAAVAEAARVSPTTVRRGVTELDSAEEPLPVGRARRAGGGRRPVTAHDPELVAALLGLVEPNARGESDVAAAVDDEVAASSGGRADRAGPSGVCADGGPAAAAEQFQSAGHGQNAGGQAASRPRCAVRLHQRAGQGPSGRWRAGDQRGCEEEGAARAAARPRPGMAPERRPGPGRGPQLLQHGPGDAAGHPVRRLRPDHRCGMGERRGRPRHLGVRRRLDPALVGRPR